MLELRSVSKIYGKGKRVKVNALKNVNLTLPERGMVFLLGRSGSGKSTLLNLIGGLDVPTSGEIIAGGRSLSSFTPSELDGYRNSFAGFVFQEYNLIDQYTVGSNVALALELQGKANDRARIEEVLRRVDLVDSEGNTLYERKISELSGGQKQRVAIARALVKEPKMILADEPTGALDSKTGEQLFLLLQALSKERLVVIVTHDRESAKQYGDRIIEVSDGEIVGDSNPQQEKTEGTIPFRKGKLSFRRAFRLGTAGLKRKPFRLISSVLLSLIVFVVATVFVSFGTSDEARTVLSMTYENGFSIAKIGYSVNNGFNAWFTEEQLDLIRAYTGKQELAKAYYRTPKVFDFFDLPYLINKENPYYSSFREWSSMEIDAETGEEDWNLTPDARLSDKTACRLPTEVNEIAITDLFANAMLQFGIRGYEEKPKSVDEIIGKQVDGGYTVVGIYSTEMPTSFYEQYDYETDGAWRSDNPYVSAVCNGAGDTILHTVFLCQDYWKKTGREEKFNTVYVKLSGNIQKDREFLRKLNQIPVHFNLSDYIDPEDEDTFYKTEQEVRDFFGKPSFLTPYSQLVEDKQGDIFRQIWYTPLKAVFLSGMGVVTVFSILLTMNFLNASLDCRRRELGILRAMGASRSDLVSVCLSESMTLAAIEFALALACSAIGCAVYNAYAEISVLTVWGFPILALFGFSFAVSALATVIPVLRLASRKPVDILREA
ncbi:MAG: ABC transporter ATP-binding protein/permease [Clostridia bacterium]|nr:ABC transporter ATP-binding protein/permease [Clostridia bacterium]